jgi:hypothetical protein
MNLSELKRLLAVAAMAGALPAAAAMPECMQEAQQLQMALAQHPPIDPHVMNDVLSLQHEGLGLCQQGAGAKGRGKLQEALQKATPPGLAALPPTGAPAGKTPGGRP